MGLSKRRIGDLIALNNKKNIDDLDLPFYGINKDKSFMPTVAAVEGLDRKKYKIVSKGVFVFSGMQTGRDMCIRIGLYNLDFDALVSPAYTTFDVISEDILPEYLFLVFKSDEMDRYGAFLSDGSIRSNLDWDVFCNIELELPSVDVQKKYVDIYKELEQKYLEVTKCADRVSIMGALLLDRLKKTSTHKTLSQFIEEIEDKNIDGKERIQVGVSKEGFIDPRQKRDETTMGKCTIVKYHNFVYSPSRVNIGSIMFSSSKEEMVCSEEYVVFRIKDENQLLPEYLLMWLKRSECGRYMKFATMDSVRNRVYYEDMEKVKIPIPSIEEQRIIALLYSVLEAKKQIATDLWNQMVKISPILVRGSIMEGSR